MRILKYQFQLTVVRPCLSTWHDLQFTGQTPLCPLSKLQVANYARAPSCVIAGAIVYNFDVRMRRNYPYGHEKRK